MALTTEQRRENGRKGAEKRWGKTDPAARRLPSEVRIERRVASLRTEALKLGYRLVPIEPEVKDGDRLPGPLSHIKVVQADVPQA
jgi:hypothetical protein